MAGATPVFLLREAEIGDAAEIARLGTELGYPADAGLMLPRLQAALGDGSRHVVVAATGDGLLGWIGVERRSTLETGDKAEIAGLVVDARARRLGVGQALVEGIRRYGHLRVSGLENAAVLPRIIKDEARAGDLVVLLGAGDITSWAYALPGQLEALAQ